DSRPTNGVRRGASGGNVGELNAGMVTADQQRAEARGRAGPPRGGGAPRSPQRLSNFRDKPFFCAAPGTATAGFGGGLGAGGASGFGSGAGAHTSSFFFLGGGGGAFAPAGGGGGAGAAAGSISRSASCSVMVRSSGEATTI